MIKLFFNYFKKRWMSEKLDGVRAYWNGKTLISRNGKEIECPNWFIEHLPIDISLDGELWLGKGSFELVNGILKSFKDSIEWKNIIFMIFEFPNSNEPYEIRIRNLENLNLSNHIQIVNIERCIENHQIQKYLTTIVNEGGEGLMVNKPNSFYISTRVDSLLKIKVNFILSL